MIFQVKAETTRVFSGPGDLSALDPSNSGEYLKSCYHDVIYVVDHFRVQRVTLATLLQQGGNTVWFGGTLRFLWAAMRVVAWMHSRWASINAILGLLMLSIDAILNLLMLSIELGIPAMKPSEPLDREDFEVARARTPGGKSSLFVALT